MRGPSSLCNPQGDEAPRPDRRSGCCSELHTTTLGGRGSAGSILQMRRLRLAGRGGTPEPQSQAGAACSGWLTWQAFRSWGWLRLLILSLRLRTTHDCSHKLRRGHTAGTHATRARRRGPGQRSRLRTPRNELENIRARPRSAGAGPPRCTPTQGAKAQGPPGSSGPGVQSWEDAGAAAGSALRAGRADRQLSGRRGLCAIPGISAPL